MIMYLNVNILIQMLLKLSAQNPDHDISVYFYPNDRIILQNCEISIKEVISDTDLTKYYNDNSDDAVLTDIFHRKVSACTNFLDAVHMSYEYLVINDHLDAINYIIVHGQKDSIELDCICLIAIDLNRIDILKLLSVEKYNFNKKINGYIFKSPKYMYELTPLSYSCVLSKFDIIECVINYGADINYSNGTVFQLMCEINCISVVNYFLRLDINLTSMVNGLIIAFINNHMEIVNSIIEPMVLT
jgi:hypothetical protein